MGPRRRPGWRTTTPRPCRSPRTDRCSASVTGYSSTPPPSERLPCRRPVHPIHPETAQVTARFTSGDLAGRPAVLVNERGAGRVVYVGTRLDRPGLARTLLGAAAGAGISPVVAGAPEFVEATRRATDSAEYLFLLNDTAASTGKPGFRLAFACSPRVYAVARAAGGYLG